jgi:predicted XRE-type DNA-binding protein
MQAYKLTENDVMEIRELLEMGGLTQNAIGARYGVTQSAISAIARGKVRKVA